MPWSDGRTPTVASVQRPAGTAESSRRTACRRGPCSAATRSWTSRGSGGVGRHERDDGVRRVVDDHDPVREGVLEVDLLERARRSG
ncbi:hypothetical protein IU11_11370 [Cellulosimicrobium sp. MM]|nr:hypothetical protein IU11_11370 [Cellulosimicrobium sp. MM]